MTKKRRKWQNVRRQKTHLEPLIFVVLYFIWWLKNIISVKNKLRGVLQECAIEFNWFLVCAQMTLYRSLKKCKDFWFYVQNVYNQVWNWYFGGSEELVILLVWFSVDNFEITKNSYSILNQYLYRRNLHLFQRKNSNSLPRSKFQFIELTFLGWKSFQI